MWRAPSTLPPTPVTSVFSSDAATLLDQIVAIGEAGMDVEAPTGDETDGSALVLAMLAAGHPSIVLRLCAVTPDSFFSVRAPLRLALCAAAAFYDTKRSFHPSLWMRYFVRARDAVSRVADTPHIETLQALQILSFLADDSGQLEDAKLFRAQTVEQMLALRLHVDPDDPSWSSEPSLSERERNQRRYWFWYIALTTKYRAATGLGKTFDIDISHVKPPAGEYAEFNAYVAHAKIYCIISSIQQLYSCPPTSHQDILLNQDSIHLNGACISLLSEFPPETILLPDPSRPARDLYHLYTLQLQNGLRGDILGKTLNLYTAICMLHRPKLALLAILAPDAACMRNPRVAADLFGCVEAALDAARHVLRVARLMLLVTKGREEEEEGVGVPRLYDVAVWDFGFGFNFLEAAAVLWMAACKVRLEAWRALVPRLPGKDGVCEDLRVAVRVLRMLEGKNRGDDHGVEKPNYLTPVLACVHAMAMECETVGNVLEGVVEDVEITMTVLSLQEGPCVDTSPFRVEGSGEPVPDLKAVRIDEMPNCYMGLLGFTVMGWLRWKGPQEEAWRNFWKKERDWEEERTRLMFTTSQSISGVTIDVVQAVHDVPTDDSEFVVNDHADGLVEFIASKAWPAGLVLAEYFVWRLRNLPLESPDPNRPLRFLELGAGTGITSLFAAKTLGDHRSSVHVYVSDLALACPLIQANIAANLDHATNVSMHALPLDWTDIPSTETWLASLDPPGLDIVYASDV
ncbi:hypothetical protein BC830DRAFT_1175284, partial [Chytriomyces sp. MP71]